MAPPGGILSAWPRLVLVAAALGAVLALAEALRRGLGWPSDRTRPLVHAAVGLVVVGLPSLFARPEPVVLLAGVFAALNAWTRSRGVFASMHAERRESVGTVTFPIALMVTAPWCWGPERVWMLQTGFLVLALADPIAAAVGRREPARRVLAVGGGGKSVDGTLAFLAVAAGAAGVGVAAFGGARAPGWAAPETWIVAGLVAVAAAAIEVSGRRGWDNLFVVPGVIFVLIGWFDPPAGAAGTAAGLGAGLVFAAGARSAGWLDTAGALAGGLFAATLVGLGGRGWIVPGLVFFVGSSALTRTNRSAGGVADGPEGRSRTAAQVYANGGAAWLACGIHAVAPGPLPAAAFLGALASATADTWSAEIGPRLQRRPFDLRTGERVLSGTSGAVSAGGTAAGVTGAVLVGAAYCAVVPAGLPGIGTLATLVTVAAAGASGGAADSLLGAFAERRFEHVFLGVASEAPPGRFGAEGFARTPRPWRLVRGRPWMGNHLVNALCTATGAAVALAVLALA